MTTPTFVRMRDDHGFYVTFNTDREVYAFKTEQEADAFFAGAAAASERWRRWAEEKSA